MRAEISSVAIPGDDPERAVFAVAWLEPEAPLTLDAGLTPRQKDVLDLLAEGASTEQISAGLHLTTETARNYIRQLLSALGAHSRLEAVVVVRNRVSSATGNPSKLGACRSPASPALSLR